MKLELITDFSILELNRDRWDRVASDFQLRLDGFENDELASGQAKPFPFYSWNWLGSWFQAFEFASSEPVLRPAVVVGRSEDGEWIGIAPLCIDNSSRLGTRLRWWGSGDACSDYMGPFCHRDHEPAFSLALADWLEAATKPNGELADVDVIELEGGSSESLSNRRLDEALDAVGFRSHIAELEGCWVVDLPDQWDKLNQRLSKSMRRKTKKAVQRVHGSDAVVRSSSSHDIEELWQDFVNLHQARRRALGQEGCFANPAFERFLKSSVVGLASKGQAELIVLDFENQPLASMLLLNDGVTNFMYQSGVDVDRMKLEPGYQVAYLSIFRSIQNGFKRFDFLRGDEPYKSRWDTKRIAISRTRWVPRKIRSVVKHNLWLAGRSLKHWILGSAQAIPQGSEE